MGNIEKFDQIANQYDTPERVEISKVIGEEIRAHIASGREKDAVDYGCGTGLVGMQLLDEFQSLLFADASAHMIEQVERKIANLPAVPRVSALCCDFTENCPADLHADYILLVQTLLHIREVDPLLANLHRILRQGGHLLIVDFDKNESIVSGEVHNGFVQEELIRRLIETGFSEAHAQTFYHGKKMFMHQDASLFIMDALK